MVSIEARSRQMCDMFYFNTADELAWYLASDARFASHLKICCWFFFVIELLLLISCFVPISLTVERFYF